MEQSIKSSLEAVARVNSNIRRFYALGTAELSSGMLTVRDLELDPEGCVLKKNGEPIELTSVEYRIMELFMKHPGKVFTKQQIYEQGWGCSGSAILPFLEKDLLRTNCGSFYPLSDGNPTLYHRITKSYFRTCSTRRCRSQAPFCLCTLQMVSDHSEGTFERLRYPFGGDRPSQTPRPLST